ncbi:hypothetical protein DXG03_002434 [Asterophora parasitica]|uniref:Uncharacterized protein n=1 Tax=Asterophora parasitica TaxID=117018 RepID=A0A9P7GGS3_9AGAR|nr:hypothetical protein DXG03_002434 [Asterophora parasitica]
MAGGAIHEFMHTLAQCTSLDSLGLSVGDQDVDLKFCLMLPACLADLQRLEGFQFKGPRIMASKCDSWIEHARDKSRWLPELKRMTYNVAYSGLKMEKTYASEISNATARAARFMDATASNRPHVEVFPCPI